MVTGSSRGVGKFIAEHALACGAVVVGVSRGEASLANKNYLHLPADIADPMQLQVLFAEIRKAVGRIDILVNSAAVLSSQYAMIMPVKAAEAMVATNLLAPFLTCREAAKLMKKTRWGRIVNVSSMAVSLEPPGDSVYAATKAGLQVLTNILAKEFAPLNVTCNTLGISAIDTDMLGQLPAVAVEKVVQSLPIPRKACPEDVLNVLDFFISERSDYITAQTIYLGGVH